MMPKASWAIDSEPIRARGIIVKYPEFQSSYHQNHSTETPLVSHEWQFSVYSMAYFAIGDDKANILVLIGYYHAWSITHIYCTYVLHSWNLMPDSRLCVSLSSKLFYTKQLVLGPSLPKFRLFSWKFWIGKNRKVVPYLFSSRNFLKSFCKR